MGTKISQRSQLEFIKLHENTYNTEDMIQLYTSQQASTNPILISYYCHKYVTYRYLNKQTQKINAYGQKHNTI